MTAAPVDTEVFSFRGIPRWVWVVALLVAAARMTPYAVAAWRTPDGWTFTGNLSISPDYMQYRTWSRQTQVEGPLVSNRFTAEPNPRHIPVGFYWGVGQLSRLTGTTPEWVYAWLGVPLTVVLVLLAFVTARGFLRPPAIPWALGMMLIGGGLGAVLLFIRESGLGAWYPLHALVVEPLSGPTRAVPFEGYRGNYILHALLDTHFLAFWIAALAAVMGLAATVLDYSRRRLAWTVLLFIAATVLHVYEGITLMAIAFGVTAVATARGFPWRRAVAIVMVTGAGVTAVLAAAWWLLSRSGLPTPAWRGLNVPPMILLLAFPVSWLLLAIGGGRLWREGGLKAAVLFGWAAGCLALVLSGPFFPYPDRGTMTLQVPLVILAAAVYFRDRVKVRPGHIAVLVVLAGPTLAFRVWQTWGLRYDGSAHHIWIHPEHRRLIDAVAAADSTAVLIADETSLRWLGPEFPGRHFAGHFFLTVDYDRKRAALDAFFDETDPARQAAFLREVRPTLLFVPVWRDPARFELMGGLEPLVAEPPGTLFRVNLDAIGLPRDTTIASNDE
jgi:hypothetical protein